MVQAYYDVKYLFTVQNVLIRLKSKIWSHQTHQKQKEGLETMEILFKQIVKQVLDKKKKLSNALKSLDIPEYLKSCFFMDKRAEEQSVEDFINYRKNEKQQKIN